MALKKTFNLSDVLATAFTSEQRRALTPLISSPVVKKEFGQRAIERIRERTESGKDVDGARFTPYSKAYKRSDEFAIFGKSSRPNLKLTGEMLASMFVLTSGSTSVTIGYQDGTQNDKARRHNFGLKKMPRREFFDLTTKEQGDILKEIFREQNAVDRLEEISDALSSLDADVQTETVIGETETQTTSLPLSLLSILGDIAGGENGET